MEFAKLLVVAVPALALGTAMSPRPALQALAKQRGYSSQTISAIDQKLVATANPLDAVADLATARDTETRLIAAELLGECGNAASAPLLWKLLADRSEAVGTMAAYALGRLPHTMPVPLDFDALNDPRPSVRRLAAEALGRIGRSNAEPALRHATADTDDLVRLRAANALRACGGPASIPTLASLLTDPNRSVRRSAVVGLGKLGGLRAVEPLVTALKDPDTNVRLHALSSLASLADTPGGDRGAIRAAVRAQLHDDDLTLIVAAREFLDTDNDHVADTLARAVLSSDAARSGRAVEFVVRFRVTAALPLLARHVRHPDVEVRRRIVDLFRQLGGAETVPALHTALADAAPQVVLTAMVALTRLRKFASPEWFQEKLADPNPHIRAAAARFFGETGDRRHAPRVSALLFDDNRFVRAAAAEALGRFGDRSVIPPLMDILTQQPPRGEPGGAPGGTNTATVVGAGRDTLLEFVAREMIRHKQEAIRILGDMRASEAVSAIIASGLRSEHGDLRATAAYSLGQIGDRKAVEPLLESLRDFYAVASLDTSGVIAAGNPRFSHTVRHDFEAAIRARLNAVWALGRLGDAAAKPLLSQAQNDFNSLVRDAATEALAEIEKRAPLFADNRP